MDCGRWISRFAFAGLSILVLAGTTASAQKTAAASSIVAVRMINRAPLCFTARIAVACRDWESGHAYNPGDQIMPKIANPLGLTFKATGAGKSDPSEPTWPQTVGTTVQDGPNTTGVPWVAEDSISRHFIRVEFSDPHAAGKDSELSPSNTAATTTPSNKALKLAKNGVLLAAFQDQVLVFELSDDAVTSPGDTGVKVCFTTYTFKGKTPPADNFCGDGKIYNDANISDLVSDSKKVLNSVVSTPKTSAEKDIFAGLSISVPSGGGDTQGSGDLNFNQNFAFPLVGQGIFGLEIKKGSSTNADPRHFTGGITARKTFLLHLKKSDLSNLLSAIESTSGSVNAPALTTMANLQKSFFRSIYFDNGLSYEGDISHGSIGNIGNVLYNADIWVNTAARPLSKQSGFFNFRLLPVGVEAGYNVSSNASTAPPPPSGTTPTGNYSLVRLKSGATFILSSQSPYRTDNSGARLDLEISAVNRYLFEKELIYDDKTKSYSSTGTGNKYWAQIALKILGGSIGSGPLSGRPGLKLGFERGFLPPVYAFTKVFTISLIYETNDNNSQEIKLVDQK